MVVELVFVGLLEVSVIVLIGEYSGVHYCLAEALKRKGHDVTLISDGDAYKKFPSDITVPQEHYTGMVKYIHLFLFFLGCTGLINYLKLKKRLSSIANIHTVQFINPVAIPSLGAIGNFLLFINFKKRADVVSLCALGDDRHWVMACIRKKFKYSALDRLFTGGLKGFLKYSYSLKYILSPMFVLLDAYVVSKSDIIVPGLTDYVLPYSNNKKSTGKIPLPIDINSMVRPEGANYPIKIFHGWQTGKEAKKGNDILHAAALKCVSSLGEGVVSYETVGGLPYSEYIKRFKEADIFLDQVYSYDCGVNALLAMASGKVVFSGFESNCVEDIGVNATPSVDEVFHQIVSLIKNKERIDTIKYNAYEYVVKTHESSIVADRYLKVWGSACS